MPGIDKAKLDKFRKGELKFVQIFNLDSKQIASLLLAGHNFFAQGRIEEATAIFEGMALLDPNNPYVNNVLGSIYQQTSQYEKAILRYSIALNIFPNDIGALTNRGEIYLTLGKFEDAARDLRKAVELDPSKKHPSANRARLLVSFVAEQLESMKTPAS
jgi:Flp pilus assembly protein TadD